MRSKMSQSKRRTFFSTQTTFNCLIRNGFVRFDDKITFGKFLFRSRINCRFYLFELLGILCDR